MPKGEGRENRHRFSAGPAEPKEVKLFPLVGDVGVAADVSCDSTQEQWVNCAKGLIGENVTN